MQVSFFCFAEIRNQFFVGLEEFLILVGDQELKLLGELNLVQLHLDLNAFGVAFLVEVLIIAAQEGEVQVGVVECVHRHPLFSLKLYRSLAFAFLDQTFLLLHKILEGGQVQDLTFYLNLMILSANEVLILELDQAGSPQFIIIDLIVQEVFGL